MKKVMLLYTLIFICLALNGCKLDKTISKDTSADSSTATSAQSSVDRGEEASSGVNTDVDLDKFDLSDKDDSDSGIWMGSTINKSKQYTRFFFKKFNGIKTIDKFAENSTVEYKSNIKGGKLNVVILDSDYTVLKVLSANTSGSLRLDFADSEEYILRAVGDEAIEGEVVIQVE